MEHAASPSLISLGLTSDKASAGPSFRWGLVSSCVLHAFVFVIAMFVKFQSDMEQPFRTIDVALISLPAVSTLAPKPVPPTTKKKPVPPITKKKAVVTPPPKKAAPAPPPEPTAPPVEEILPPLPTNSASERLSESLGGAIKSIAVPQKRELNSGSRPTPTPAQDTSKDQAPLIDNLRLPSAPPTIARPKRLQPAPPIKTPSLVKPQSTASRHSSRVRA